MDAFPELLRDARSRARLTQGQLAARAGLTADAVASYESGRRRPRRDHVIDLADALQVEAAELNRWLDALGYEQVPGGRLRPMLDRRKPLAALQEEAERYSWPCLINNENFDIIGWNEAANDVAEMDLAVGLAEPGARHLLRMTAMPHFRARLLNWQEPISVLAGMYKNDQVSPDDAEPRNLTFAHVLAYLQEHAPDFLLELLQLWERVPPLTNGRRNNFNVTWRTSDGAITRYHGVTTPWSDFDGAWGMDWHPADGETWRWLDAARARREEAMAATPPGAFLPAAATWRQLLRNAREARECSRSRLAAVCGVSAASIYAYETGRLQPTRETILRLTRALELDGATTNAILSAAGHAPEPSDFALMLAGEPRRASGRRYYRPEAYRPMSWRELQEQVNGHEWPCVVVDTRCDVQCANEQALRIFGGELLRRTGAARSLLWLVTSAEFRARCRNWDEAVGAILPDTLSPYFEHWRESGSAGGRAPHLRAVAAAIRASGDPGALAAFERVLHAWDAYAGRRLTARVVFVLAWEGPGGEPLRFNTIVSPYNTWDAAWAIDLHPADPATWSWLARDRS